MNIGQVFQEIVNSAKNEAELALLPLIAATVSNIAANPTALNIAAQGNLLIVSLVAKLPGIEQAVLGQIAAAINTALQLELAKVPAPKV